MDDDELDDETDMTEEEFDAQCAKGVPTPTWLGRRPPWFSLWSSSDTRMGAPRIWVNGAPVTQTILFDFITREVRFE